MSGTGITVADPGFESAAAWRSSELGASFSERSARSLDVLFMTYASRLGVEGTADPSYRTSASYVRSVVDTALRLTREDVVDGSLVYVLDLRGTDTSGGEAASYDAVAALYGAYR